MPDTLDGRAKLIIDQVIDLEGRDRSQFLERLEDPDLRRRVESLLALMEKEDGFLHEPTVNVSPASLERPGGRIGPYTLTELIGEGGFGSVYSAEQTLPVRRQVALKIIKLGMDTRQVIARFEAERQALAMMDHPNIARVLDVGATDNGRPYFVMELVRGEPITGYCDRQRLSIRERLALFREICGAVQHAHQKGVIHRDLKPSNVLVTVVDGRAVAKVIDFGIAKATAGRLTDASLHTELHQLIGTPEYMSPEQADPFSADVDTRSDIYSLGVLLFELLTGDAPFDRQRLRSAPFAELQRILREEEPLRPSLRLATPADSSRQGRFQTPPASTGSSLIEIAQCRHTEPFPLTRAIRGDLDWIALKCLEKDRSRRYQTAGALADDVGRHLSDEPVTAGPPSAAYRMRKFVKRNRAAVIAGAVSVVVLLIATGVSIAFGLSEARHRKAAELARDQLNDVARFQEAQFAGIDAEAMGMRLRSDLLTKVRLAAEGSKLPADQVEARVRALEDLISGGDFTGMAVRSMDENVFQPALTAIETQFQDQPVVKARLLQTMAGTLRDLGLLSDAVHPQEEALRIRREALGEDHPNTLQSLENLGFLQSRQGKYTEAESLLRDALERQRRILGDKDHETVLTKIRLGGVLYVRGDLVGALSHHEDALRICRAELAPGDELTLLATVGMADVLQQQGKYGDAEKLYRDALEAMRQAKGDGHSLANGALHGIGVALQSQGKLSESEEYFRKTLELNRSSLGEDHPLTLNSIAELANFLADVGKLSDAESSLREVLPRYRRLLGDDHSLTLSAISNLGHLLHVRGKLEEAEALAREALESRRRVLGREHHSTLSSANILSQILQSRGKLAEAETLARESLEARRRTIGERHPETISSINNLGGLLWAQGKYSEAEPFYREAMEKFRDSLGEDHPRTINAISNFGMILEAQEKLTDAEPYIREALEKRRRVQGEDHHDTIGAINNMGALLNSQGKLAEAETYYREALEKYRRVLGDEHPNTIISIINLGILLERQGHAKEAEESLREALELRRKVLGAHHPETLLLVVWLGEFLHNQQRDAEALALLSPEEPAVRQLSEKGNAGVLRKFLLALGRAQLSLGDAVSAESNLLEAHELLKQVPNVSDADREATIKAIIALYDARHAAEPDGGFDKKAAEWRAKQTSAESQRMENRR